MNLVEGTTRVGPAMRRATAGRSWSIGANDLLALVAVNVVLIGAMWLRHGGLAQVGSLGGVATAAGQLTALFGTFAALLELVLLSRTPWLDHTVGSDRLVGWHRWVGFAAVWLVGAHLVLTTIGWAATEGRGALEEFISLLMDQPYVLMATVGLLMFVAVGFTSMRWVRDRLSYETWYGLHIYAYLAIALAFVHEITLGSDLADDPVALGFWVGLYVVTFGLLIWYRVLTPIRVSARHRLRVASVVHEAPDVVSIYLTGRDLYDLPVRAGQFFHVRFLRHSGWWRPHPFSISAAPNGEYLRMTIKDLGDDTHRMMTMPVGTPVFIEGPYGAFTAAMVTRPRVVMLAGGIGVTPLRAILEDLPPGPGRTTLLYREGDASEVIFGRELAEIAARTGADVRILAGHRGTPRMPIDPLSPEQLRMLVPDIIAADVLVCGSRSFTECVLHSLDRLGVSSGQIHAERFGY